MNWSTLDIASADCQLKTASVMSPQAACAALPLSSAPAATAEKSNRLTLFPPLTRDPLTKPVPNSRSSAKRQRAGGRAIRGTCLLLATPDSLYAPVYIDKITFFVQIVNRIVFPNCTIYHRRRSSSCRWVNVDGAASCQS